MKLSSRMLQNLADFWKKELVKILKNLVFFLVSKWHWLIPTPIGALVNRRIRLILTFKSSASLLQDLSKFSVIKQFSNAKRSSILQYHYMGVIFYKLEVSTIYSLIRYSRE